MKRAALVVVGLNYILLTPLFAAPGLLHYQGRLTNAAGQPITSSIDVTFTFWNAEVGGSQLGSAFSDTDTVTPDENGLYATLIGDDPGTPVPASIFSTDSVWLNVNVAGEDLVPRARIASVGYALSAASLSPALNNPGDRFTLGQNIYYEVASDGRVYLYVNGQKQGGARWFHPSGLTDTIGYWDTQGYNPEVATDSAGNTVIVWYGSTISTTRIFKSEFRNGAWVHPSALSDAISLATRDATNPTVAMDNNGNAIAVWQQYNQETYLKYQIFKSEYRGGVWSHPSSLSDNISPDGQDATGPKVAMSDNGSAIIVWSQSDGSKSQVFKSEYRAGVWTHPSSLSDNISPDGQNATLPQVAMDANGNALIAWLQSDGSNTQVFKSYYGGGTWTHPSSLTDNISPNGQNCYSPRVAMDNNGNALIVWYQLESGLIGAKYQVYKSEYRGTVWIHPSSLSDNISPDGQDAGYPLPAMDDKGNSIIAWQQSDGSKRQMFKSEYRGGAWTHPAGLTDNFSPDGQDVATGIVADVDMTPTGDALIVWLQSNGSHNQVFKSEYRAGAWTHPLSLSDNISPDGQASYRPRAAMGANGNASIVWYQFDGSKNRIQKSDYVWGF